MFFCQIAEIDDKKGFDTDTVGMCLCRKHRYNMIECVDANGNTPLSEASSWLTYY